MSQPFVPSLLDRLSDAPTLDKMKSRSQVIYELCEHVRQDLESLLNAKRRCVSWKNDYVQLEKSVLNYGIDDFMNIVFDSILPEEQLCLNFEEVIRTFEPRLTRIKVSLKENFMPYDRRIKFRIEASLYIKPAYESVLFDSTLIDNGEYFSVTQELV